MPEETSKFLEARLTNPLSYKQALDQVFAWSELEVRFVLLGLLMGHVMGTILMELEDRKKRFPLIWDPTRYGGDPLQR